MAWTPISGAPTQYSKSDNTLASGYYLKFYQDGTTTAFSMATDSTGGTTLDKCQLDSSGYPTTDGTTRFVPHVNQDYKIVLYKTSADADANTTGNAEWVVDAIKQLAQSAELTTANITHQPSTPSASVLYTLENLILDLPLSVKLLGATLNDSSASVRSANDTAIQAALDYCYNNGSTVLGPVYFPGGGFYYTSSTLLHRGTVSIKGGGMYSCTISSSAATCMQTNEAAPAGSCKIEQIQLIGAGKGYDSNGGNCTRLIFELCFLNGGTGGYGFYGTPNSGNGLTQLIECEWRDCVVTPVFKIENAGASNNSAIRNTRINAEAGNVAHESGNVLVLEAGGTNGVFKLDNVVVEIGGMSVIATGGNWLNFIISGLWAGDVAVGRVGTEKFSFSECGNLTIQNVTADEHVLDFTTCNDVSIDNVRCYAVDTADGWNDTNRLWVNGLITSVDTKAQETSGAESRIVHEGTVYGTGRTVTRTSTVHFPADGAAADTWTRYLGASDRAGRLSRVIFIPESAITADGTNYAQLKIKVQGGGVTTDTASFDTESVSAGALYTFDVSTGATLTGGTTIAIEKTIQGSGMAMPAMTVLTEFEDTGWT